MKIGDGDRRSRDIDEHRLRTRQSTRSDRADLLDQLVEIIAVHKLGGKQQVDCRLVIEVRVPDLPDLVVVARLLPIPDAVVSRAREGAGKETRQLPGAFGTLLEQHREPLRILDSAGLDDGESEMAGRQARNVEDDMQIVGGHATEKL